MCACAAIAAAIDRKALIDGGRMARVPDWQPRGTRQLWSASIPPASTPTTPIRRGNSLREAGITQPLKLTSYDVTTAALCAPRRRNCGGAIGQNWHPRQTANVYMWAQWLNGTYQHKNYDLTISPLNRLIWAILPSPITTGAVLCPQRRFQALYAQLQAANASGRSGTSAGRGPTPTGRRGRTCLCTNLNGDGGR